MQTEIVGNFCNSNIINFVSIISHKLNNKSNLVGRSFADLKVLSHELQRSEGELLDYLKRKEYFDLGNSSVKL